MKKISIIIPVYNGEKYLDRCINSILSQSYKNFEALFLDDGSKDKSLKILKKYEKFDSRIKVYHHDNVGVAKTRNEGIKRATGEYITFLDNDDYLDKDFLKNYLEKCQNYDFIVGGYKRVSNNKILLRKTLKNNKFSKYENVAPWGKLIKRKFLLKNNIEFFSYPIGEDIIFNMKMFSKTNNYKVINNCDYNWFFNDESVSNTKQQHFNDNILKLFEEMNKYSGDELSDYFITRYKTWYLLFSGKGESSKEFCIEYKKINNWLIKNNYINKISFKKIIHNESTVKNIIFISLFYIIEKLKLIELFSKIYCKG